MSLPPQAELHAVPPPRPHALRGSRMLRPRRAQMGPAVALLLALWFVTVFDPQWLLASRGITAALRLPVVLFLALGVALGWSALTNRSFGSRWTWFAPFLCFIAVSIGASAFAPNLSLARDVVQALLLYWVLIVGTVALVDSARRAELLVLGYAFQFVWWGLWGARGGLVFWDPVLSNFDGFGAWMVVGGGLCGFLLTATDDKRVRRSMMLAVGLCVIGMVASFARGAFLAAMAVFLVVWIRSPHKGRMFGAAIACGVLVAAAASILFGNQYWMEMATILEGTSEETGSDRWEMWQAAWQVFLARPILGSGPDNWGAFAASYFQPGEIGGVYGQNPLILYGRQAHSSYVTILAEEGILGVVTFVWILADFWRRNALLRTEEAARRWASLGGKLRLRPVALGLEAALVGWMGAAAFYSLSGSHWLYTLLALNLLLHALVVRAGGPMTPDGRGRRAGRRFRSPRPAPAAGRSRGP